MTINSGGHTLARNRRLQLAGLMLLSTVLYVAGVALERSSSGNIETRAPASQLAPTASVGEIAPEGSAAREAQESQPAAPAALPAGAEGTADHEQAEQHRVFGVDIESPGAIAGVVLGTLLLIVALFVFGYRVLPLVLIIVLIATVLDVREVVYQFGQAHYGIALLAVGVALSRLATVLAAGLAWREGRRGLTPVVA